MAQLQAKEAEGWDEYRRTGFVPVSSRKIIRGPKSCVAALTVATRRSADWHSFVHESIWLGLTQLAQHSIAVEVLADFTTHSVGL